jgi:carboxylesterase type B
MRLFTTAFVGAASATAAATVVVATGAPTVTLSGGAVFGRALPASGGVPVNEFLGIPFGEPTTRWEPPVDFSGPLPESPFNATMWGRACLQVLSSTSSYGSEDCLRANVWQPANATPSVSNLPVIVFVYGGSDQFGEAEPYNMSGLAAFQDVVAVNFNYRTGPIGYMAFEDDVQQNKSTGNFAILDVQSALRWVQREIKAFGGDPTRVAIHGQSSGGALAEVGANVGRGVECVVWGVGGEQGGG